MELRRYVTLRDPSGGPSVDVVIEADESAPASDIVALLDRAAPARPVHLGGAALPTAGTFASMGIGDGAVLGCGSPIPAGRITTSAARPELHVVGGPMAGTVLRLGDDVEVGRTGRDVQLPLDDMVSRRHLRIGRSSEGFEVEDLKSANGTDVEGVVLDAGARTAGPSDIIRIGNSLLRISPPTSPELPLVIEADGTVGLNRRFRTGSDALDTSVEMPQEPSYGERPALNLLLTIFPAVAIAAIAIAMRRPEFIVFAAVGPIGGMASALLRRRAHDKRHLAAVVEYQAALKVAKERTALLRSDEKQRLRASAPDLASVVQCARAGGRLLWAIRPAEPDFLQVRLGSTSRPSTIVPDKGEREHLWMVPATVDLAKVGGVAITGDLDRARGVARAAVLQLAVHRAPTELKLIVLGSAASESAWSWTRWVPHCRWSSDEEFALIGSDAATVRARLSELRTLIKRRQEELLKRRDSRFLPSIVVVYDDVSTLLPDAADVLRDGPTVGVHAITVDAVHIPDGCNASLSFGSEGDDARLEQAGAAPQDEVIPDEVAVDVCDVAARCLAPLRLVGESSSTELPQDVRLLDLLGVDPSQPATVQASWRARSRGAGVPIGVAKDGTFELDLVLDGPHGVIAGMTRSGKSEFLNSLIASLAATNHPDDLAFLFIDFKGGNDYRLAARLPHTVDLATQIDAAGFERALRLLDAELVRRQAVAGSLDANNIESYWAAQARASGPTQKLPRLIVIADEFAELVQRNPEQIDRLVSVARLGAAYGVHLLLATQQPSGVVSGQIDANAPLRICFRTSDAATSSEIIGAPDAAHIEKRHKGRGFKRAHGAPPTEFQSARVRNARPGTAAAAPPAVHEWTWATAGRVPPEDARALEVPASETDFADLVEAIIAAAHADGWTENAVPWPKELAPVVRLDSLSEPSPAEIRFALADAPDRQATVQAPIVLGAGHVGIAGAPGSGRTTAVRTIAASAAESFGVDELHVYVLDHRGAGLTALRELPHVAGVSNADPDVASRLIEQLEDEVRRRQAAFETSSASALAEHNAAVAPTDRLPWLLVLIHGWEVVHEAAQTSAGSAAHDRLLSLLTAGGRYGLQAIVTGDRWAASGRVGRIMTRRLALRFEVDADFDAVGIPIRAIPSVMPPGRGIDTDGHLQQIAVLADGSGPSESAALASLAARLQEREAHVPTERRPRRIAPLPQRILLEDVPLANEGTLPLLTGVAASTSAPHWIDLANEAGAFVISGRRRSGRSEALVTIARAARANGLRVVAAMPKSSPLERLSEIELISSSGIASITRDQLAITGPTLLLIDDVELVDAEHEGLNDLALNPGPHLGIVVAGASSPIRMQVAGFVAALRRARCGLVLCPESGYDAGTFGSTTNLAPEHQFAGPAGRGVLGVAGTLDVVQVPLSP